jgi:DNA-binding MarR family transcriptional regulator
MPGMKEQPTLGYLLTDAARLIRRRFEHESRDMPMTSAQLQIVGRLARHEGLTQAALAGLLDIEPMTLSRHVDRMEAAGLVERRPDPKDRRARRLYTTEHARALIAPMRARAAVVYEDALAGLSPEERAALTRSLETIIANLTADAADDADEPERRVAAGA